MSKSTKRVIRLSPENHAIVERWQKARGFKSLSDAADDLVMYAHNRLEALRRDKERRAAETAS